MVRIYYTISVMEDNLQIERESGSSFIETGLMAFLNRISQTLYWIFLQPAVLILVHPKRVSLRASQISDARYIIAANHQSQLDPFILLATLPLGAFLKLQPVRFLAHNGLFQDFIRHTVLIFGGAFPTKPHPKYPHGLPGAFQFMEQGHTVLIFPEGQRAVYKTLPPKPGVAKLAAYPGAQVIPVQIIWKRRRWWRSCRITIGSPTDANGLSPEQIMELIHAL